jgi:hypothetical protein
MKQGILVHLVFTGWAILLGSYLGYSQEAPSSSSREETLRRFLQAYEKSNYLDYPIAPSAAELRYYHAFYDLNGDGKDEAIVYMMPQCGTGGCSLMVFTPDGDSYKVVTDSPITRPPIRVLNRSFDGWRSITFRAAGGGIPRPYEAELRFDGQGYHCNINEAPRV